MGNKRNRIIYFGILLVLTSMLLPAASASSFVKLEKEGNIENLQIVVDVKNEEYSITTSNSDQIYLNVYVNGELKKSVECSSIEISEDGTLTLIYDESVVLDGIKLKPGDTVEYTVTINEKEVVSYLEVKILDSESSKKDKGTETAPGQIKKG